MFLKNRLSEYPSSFRGFVIMVSGYRRLLSSVLALCLAAGLFILPVSADKYETSGWNSVEEFEEYALAYWIKPIQGSFQPIEDGREFGGSRSGRYHAAIDYLKPLQEGSGNGTPVYAMASGIVVESGAFWAGTDAVAIQNTDGSVLRYCEIGTDLEVGDRVIQGQQVGKMIPNGSSGLCMLHLELYLGTATGNLGSSSSNTYDYVSGSYSRRRDLLDPTFLLKLEREPEPHEHNWDESGYCSVCENFLEPANCHMSVVDGVYRLTTESKLYDYPYTSSNMVNVIPEGAALIVTGAVINGLGEGWAKCIYAGKSGYVYALDINDDIVHPVLEPPDSEDVFGASAQGYLQPQEGNSSDSGTGSGGNVFFPDNTVLDEELSPDSYYYEPMQWALRHNLIVPASNGLIGPEETCTRSEGVMVLWRAAGSPLEDWDSNPFTDVRISDPYYDAVLWAVKHRITSGTSATTFSPGAPITRAQAVTFLWHMMGDQNIGQSPGFTDVPSDSYFYNSVSWAVAAGITSGVSSELFAPDQTCTRAQMITFLYRLVNAPPMYRQGSAAG